MRPLDPRLRRRPLWLIVALVVVALGAASPGSTAGVRAGGARADCSTATARQLVNQFHLNNFLVPNPVSQLLCGPFTGPGSEAMAVGIGPAPTCWPVQRWAVFSFTGAQWRLILDQPAYLAAPLAAVGSDIKETTAVYRLGDPRCIPTGGTHARLWHWDGSKLVAGAWVTVEAGKPLKEASFNSPTAVSSRCFMSDDPAAKSPRAHGVLCQSGRAKPRLYQQKVWLGPTGGVSICRVTGTANRCHLYCSCEENIPVLPYGQDVVVGRFRCESLRSGVSCTVVKTGKGFLINRDRVTRVG